MQHLQSKNHGAASAQQLSGSRRGLQQSSTFSCSSPVFINEIHYRNTGDDEGQFVELAGPVDTSLDGFTVVIYLDTVINGIDGSQPVVFDSNSVLAAVPGSALGMLSFDAGGLPAFQGSVGLADAAGAVCDFISYSGVLTSIAVGTFPAGVESEDIGLTETESTPVGASLGRIDGGEDAAVWAAFDVNSRGQRNPGTRPFSCPIGAFISEVHYRNTGTDEFIEVVARAGTESGLRIAAFDGDQSFLAGSLILPNFVDFPDQFNSGFGA